MKTASSTSAAAVSARIRATTPNASDTRPRPISTYGWHRQMVAERRCAAKANTLSDAAPDLDASSVPACSAAGARLRGSGSPKPAARAPPPSGDTTPRPVTLTMTAALQPGLRHIAHAPPPQSGAIIRGRARASVRSNRHNDTTADRDGHTISGPDYGSVFWTREATMASSVKPRRMCRGHECLACLPASEGPQARMAQVADSRRTHVTRSSRSAGRRRQSQAVAPAEHARAVSATRRLAGVRMPNPDRA